MVQLAPLPDGVDLSTVQGEKNMVAELNKLFGLVSKSNMVQFKLKVQKSKEKAAEPAAETPAAVG